MSQYHHLIPRLSHLLPPRTVIGLFEVDKSHVQLPTYHPSRRTKMSTHDRPVVHPLCSSSSQFRLNQYLQIATRVVKNFVPRRAAISDVHLGTLNMAMVNAKFSVHWRWSTVHQSVLKSLTPHRVIRPQQRPLLHATYLSS